MGSVSFSLIMVIGLYTLVIGIWLVWFERLLKNISGSDFKGKCCRILEHNLYLGLAMFYYSSLRNLVFKINLLDKRLWKVPLKNLYLI